MRYDGLKGVYYDFKDGDVLTWRERKLGTLIHEQRDECDWWHLVLTDSCERDMFIGYGKEMTQKNLDDCVNVFYRGLTIGLVFNQEMEDTAFRSIPVGR